MQAFYHLLGNSLIDTVTNFFVWASVIYWGYLETASVLTTSVISGIYLVGVAACGFWFGSIVDHHRKKTAMLISSVATLVLFSIALAIHAASPADAFRSVTSPRLWTIVVLLRSGAGRAKVPFGPVALVKVSGNIIGLERAAFLPLFAGDDRRARRCSRRGFMSWKAHATSG
jgi:MFS family permease